MASWNGWKLIEIQVRSLKSQLLPLAFYWSPRKLWVFSIPVIQYYFAADQNNPRITIGTRQRPHLQWSHLSLRHFWCNKSRVNFLLLFLSFASDKMSLECNDLWKIGIDLEPLIKDSLYISLEDSTDLSEKGRNSFNNVFSGILSTICKKF